MAITSIRKPFSPVQIGSLALGHCVVMAPLTRSRWEQPGAIPGKPMPANYTQRASEGGLIVSERTSISNRGQRMALSKRRAAIEQRLIRRISKM
jgi:2,4-dienoyl-CoA reductase-like NADH-dependent reductase (Old Yellow Enzyme family)